METFRTEEYLRSDAKRYAKRLHEFCTTYLFNEDLKLGHCQEAVARYLFGFESWNHLAACDAIQYPVPGQKELLSFTFKLWLDGRFDMVEPLVRWFEPMDWFGQQVPVCSRHLSFESVLAAAAFALAEEDKEVPAGVPYIYRWSELHADHHENDPAFKIQESKDWDTKDRTEQLGGYHWRTLWWWNYIHGPQESSDEAYWLEVARWAWHDLKDEELAKLVTDAGRAAGRDSWPHYACAFVGVFDNGKELRKHIEQEGVEVAKAALRFMIENNGQAPMPA